jgi:DNA-binding transcriptional LysR family regulator
MRKVDISAINLNLLTIADSLFETCNVSETAERVHLSQPAVSRALGRLREQLDDQLLVREGRNMVLTPYAKKLGPALRKALLELSRALQQEQTFDAREARGRLTIASADFAALVFFPLAIESLAQRAPHLELVMVPYVEPFEALLESNRCDLTMGPRPSTKSWIISEPLFETGWACVARRGHPWLSSPTLDGFCQARHLMVSPSGQGGGPVDAVLGQLGRSRQVVARVPEFVAAITIVAQSELLMAVPAMLAQKACEVLPLVSAELPFSLPSGRIFISWHDARTNEPRSSWLRQLVAKMAALGPAAK